MKVINENKRLLFTLKEKTSGLLVVAPEELVLVNESLNQTTPVDPRPYKVYTALLTQSGTDAPVATVLENTLGEITFSYGDVGSYAINSNNLFTLGKTTFNISSKITYIGVGGDLTYTFVDDESFLEIRTYKFQTPNFVAFNGLLDKNYIEIRVYN